MTESNRFMSLSTESPPMAGFWTWRAVAQAFQQALEISAPEPRRSDFAPQVLDGAHPPTNGAPIPMGRLAQVAQWSAWISPHERQVIWFRAARVPWKSICWQLRCDRTTAWRHRRAALSKIAERLNAG